MALAPWQDEVLLPAPGFSDTAPRYNIINENGQIVAQNVKIVLQNIVDQLGTQVNAENINLIIAAINAILDGTTVVPQANHAVSATNADGVTSTVPVNKGGTGQTSLAAARNAMGLGNTTGALPVANGGTGAADAATARTNLGVAYGTTAGTVCQGNDSRLSNARTPTAHDQSASTITAGTFKGLTVAVNGDPGSWYIRNIYASKGDFVAGSTALTTGVIYLVFE